MSTTIEELLKNQNAIWDTGNEEKNKNPKSKFPEYLNEAEKYARDIVDEKILSNKYVKLECKRFLDRLYDKNFDYKFNYAKVEKINKTLALLNFATGFKTGHTILSGLHPFQFFVLHNVFCWQHKETKYALINEIYLQIGRKNGKTFLSSLIMIIGLIISDDFSQLYSGAKTRQLAGLIFKEMNDTLAVSPKIDKLFKRTKTYIKCLKTESTFSVVSSEANNSNGTRPQMFLLDEVAVQTDFSLWDALKYGQLSVRNPLSISISTAYTVDNNIFKQQCQYLKEVLTGMKENEHVFGLLFELDDEDLNDWDNPELWSKASPIQMGFPEGRATLIEECQKAKDLGGSKIAEFQSKMLNMWVDDSGAASFISIDDLRKCKLTEPYNWYNREVYIGLDLALTTDNCAVSFVTYDTQLKKYFCKVMCFLPEGMREEKERLEKVTYQRYEKQGYCICTSDNYNNKIVSYMAIEEYIVEVINEFNLKVKGIVSDKFNASATIQNLNNRGFPVFVQEQSSTKICLGTKRLHETLLEQKFNYEFNPLLELNMRNAMMNYDRFNNMYIDKKKSTGRIDIVDAIINCMCRFVEDEVEVQSVYENRDILVF